MTRPNRPLTSADFPPETALNAFFAWNEARPRHDRRYEVLRRIWRLEPDQAAAYLAGSDASASELIQPSIGLPPKVDITRPTGTPRRG